MSPRQRRYGRFAAAGGALVAAVLGLWLIAGRASASAPGDWAEVRRDDLVTGVPVVGTLASVQAVEIGPPQLSELWDFKIAFLAPEGAQVQPGQPVIGFDTSELERQLLDKRAERDSAQKELEKKQTDAEIARRDRELELAEAEGRFRKASLKVDVPADLVASKDLAKSREDLELARREVAYHEDRLRLEAVQAGSEVAALGRKRDRAAAPVKQMADPVRSKMVPAPRGATLGYNPPDSGEQKKVGDTTGRGHPVLELPDLRRMEADGEVDEADAGRRAVGQRVTFRLDAHPDDVFSGTVKSIGGAVQTKSEVNPLKVVRLTIDLDRTDSQRMRPGMRFLGTVEVERAPRALVVPLEAVFNRPSGPVVYRKVGWRNEEVHPVLGRRNDHLVEVRGGLRPGDLVSRHDLSADAADAAQPARTGG